MLQKLPVIGEVVPFMGDKICEAHPRTLRKNLTCFVTQKTDLLTTKEVFNNYVNIIKSVYVRLKRSYLGGCC